MRLLEYESKEILAKHLIPIPKGTLASSSESVKINPPVVLKAQIPLGGRGKAGGIVSASSEEHAKQEIERLLSSPLRGYRPTGILVEQEVAMEKEFFMAITYDTVAKSPVAIFSQEGGVDVEVLAKEQPGKVRKEHFSIGNGLPQYRAREIVAETGLSGKILLGLGNVLSSLAQIFVSYDATIVEVNPLVLTKDQKLMALDCHIEIDDDALFRHKDLSERKENANRYKELKSSSEFERRAAEIDNLDHRGVAGRVIEFEGDLGLIIGGGGASLTAFDAVRQHGGKPANYCEIGGNPSVLKVKELTKHILSKKNVDRIAIIMNVVSNTRVDLVARGIIKGVLEANRMPSDTISVFRVPGAWEDEGFKILNKYGVPICDRTVSIDEAAGLAVQRSDH